MKLLLSMIFVALFTPVSVTPVIAESTQCSSAVNVSRFYSNSWVIELQNSRLQTADNTKINANNIASLELAWVFGLDDGEAPHSYPLVTTDTVFIGAGSSNLYALDRATGCTRWQFEADGDIRTAIEHGAITIAGEKRAVLFFGTFNASAYAVDAQSGEEVWRKTVDEHSFAMVTGSPVYHAGVLYVPVSAYEVIVAAAPVYGCCDFTLRAAYTICAASAGDYVAVQFSAAQQKTFWHNFKALA